MCPNCHFSSIQIYHQFRQNFEFSAELVKPNDLLQFLPIIAKPHSKLDVPVVIAQITPVII